MGLILSILLIDLGLLGGRVDLLHHDRAAGRSEDDVYGLVSRFNVDNMWLNMLLRDIDWFHLDSSPRLNGCRHAGPTGGLVRGTRLHEFSQLAKRTEVQLGATV